MIGKTLDRFQVLREIGRGAMGRVYLARDTRLNRHVALKLLPPAMTADAGRRRRFQRESQTLAALNHPNIVTIHSIEEAEEQPFLVMEWIEGSSLASVLPLTGLPPERYFVIALPLTAAVAQAHKAGIVHRDLKPGNVMIRDDGVVKVVDFGISLIEPETLIDGPLELPGLDRERLTAEGTILGTLPYMSPEQVQRRPVDPCSDVFSLGVILYEMATGTLPFKGDSSAALAVSILCHNPAPPTASNPGLPAVLDTIVGRCLAKRPEDRYPTAAELHQDLAAILWDPGHVPATIPMAASHVGLPAPRPAVWRSSTETAASVAVLPLRNLSGDESQEYFSDGTTEMMIANLAKIGGMRVISRTSAMRYKAFRPGLKDVAQELGVHYLLEGSVLRSGDELMIIVELVDPWSDGALWGDTYRGSLGDIFSFQQQVAQEVARAIKGELSSADHSGLNDFQKVTPAVYETFLKARYLLNQRTPDALSKALALLAQALDADPGFALGWAAKAECYLYFIADGINVMPTRDGLPLAREAALRALRLDPRLSEAHVALAFTHLQSWQWASVEREFQIALELNPSNADAYHKYTLFLTARGRHEEALASIKKARRLDPLSLPLHFGVTANLLLAGRYDEAEESARATIALQPGHWLGHYQLGLIQSLRTHYAEADAELRLGTELGHRNPVALSALARNDALAGRADEARRAIAELADLSARISVPPSTLASPLLALGEVDRTLDCLDQAVEVQDQNLLFLQVNPQYRALHGHPRFQGILARVGLASSATTAPEDR
jgi:serine/threonine protein kinase/tetratricopeptide (TPR) repeat protein